MATETSETDTVLDSETASASPPPPIDLSISELKPELRHTFITVGRALAAMWWGSVAELQAIGMDPEEAADLSIELTRGVVHQILLQTAAENQTGPTAADKEQVNSFLNTFLAHVQFYNPGS